MITRFIISFFIFVISQSAFADGAEQALQPAVPAYVSVLDKIFSTLSSISSGPVLVGLAAIIELIFRFIKTEKPLSIAHAAAYVIKKIADILLALGNILDKVLPQRLK